MGHPPWVDGTPTVCDGRWDTHRRSVGPTVVADGNPRWRLHAAANARTLIATRRIGGAPNHQAWPTTDTRPGSLITEIPVISHNDCSDRPSRQRSAVDNNQPMTRPRSEIVDRENGGIYHLGSRCVRRALLCGRDPGTGRDFPIAVPGSKTAYSNSRSFSPSTSVPTRSCPTTTT